MSEPAIDTSVILPELRSRDYLPGDTVAVFASGSMVRGWGNPTSDVDVHVVSETLRTSSIGEAAHVALEPSTLPHELTFASGRRWDIEYWTTAQADQLLAKVSWAAYDSPDSPWATLTRAEHGMLERLPYAVAAAGGRWLAATQQRLRDSAHRVVLAGISLRESDGFIEDAAGQLQAGDVQSAVIAARLAFGHAVDAFQASEGQFGSLWPKWRARRMALVASPALSFGQYWALETMASFDQQNPRAWVEEVLGVCQSLSAGLKL
jgi:hypothetical protein